MIYLLFAVCSGQRTTDHPLNNFQEHGMQRIEANIKAARDSCQNAGYWTTRLLLRGSAYLCSFQKLFGVCRSKCCLHWLAWTQKEQWRWLEGPGFTSLDLSLGVLHEFWWASCQWRLPAADFPHTLEIIWVGKKVKTPLLASNPYPAP